MHMQYTLQMKMLFCILVQTMFVQIPKFSWNIVSILNKMFSNLHDRPPTTTSERVDGERNVNCSIFGLYMIKSAVTCLIPDVLKARDGVLQRMENTAAATVGCSQVDKVFVSVRCFN